MSSISYSQKIFLLLSRQLEQFSSFGSLLVEDGWQLKPISDTRILTNFTIKQDDHLYCLGIFNQPGDHQFTGDDLERVQRFRLAGNSMLIAGSSGGDSDNQTDINHIVSTFGIEFNEDCIIRPNLYKHYHPKEALLEDFIVNRGFSDALKKFWKPKEPNESELIARDNIVATEDNIGPRLLYAQGCSLKVINRTSTIMLTSSQWAIPCRQAICAFYDGNRLLKGDDKSRVVMIGSVQSMNNKYIDKEDNRAIIRTIIDYITRKEFPINISDAKTIEIPEILPEPDVGTLIDMPISCLQESEQLPKDKMSLIDKRLFSIDSSNLPSIVRAYQELDLAHEPLTLIKPEFQHKPLRLEPATHGFLIRRRYETDKGQ